MAGRAGLRRPPALRRRLTLDALAVAPIGLFAALLWPRLSLGRLFAAGIFIGLVLEPIQLLLASGTSQGASILLRGLGVAGGALVGGWLRRVARGPSRGRSPWPARSSYCPIWPGSPW